MRTAVDREVLVTLLIAGDNSPGNLAEITDRHPNSIGDSLNRLEEQDSIFDKGRGVYALTYSGVNDARAVAREYEILKDIVVNWSVDDANPLGSTDLQ